MTEATNPGVALAAWADTIEDNRRKDEEIATLRQLVSDRDAQVSQLIFEGDRFRDLWKHAQASADHHQALSAHRKASLIALARSAETVSSGILGFSLQALDAAKDDASVDIAPPQPAPIEGLDPTDIPLFLQPKKTDDADDDAVGVQVDDDPMPVERDLRGPR